MNRRTAIVLATALAASGAASAQHWGGHDRYADSSPRWDTARVVNVDPILAPAQPTFRQQCWQEPVRFVSSDRGYGRGYRGERHRGIGDNTDTVLGGIVGAAIGNQIGDGDGQRAATVAGALLGGAIARDSMRSDRYGGDGFRGQREVVRYEQRCRMVEDFQQDDRVVGYLVTYDYNGFVGTTQTSFHPGRTLRVRVDITPEP